MPERGSRAYVLRIILVIASVTVWTAAILIRLFHLQVLQHDEMQERALQKQQVKQELLAPRGIIYDSHMDELAANASVSMVVAEPRHLADIPRAAGSLASILDLNAAELRARMSDPARKRFLVVKHRVDPKSEARVEALKLDGVYLVEESMRVYPSRDLASHALGFVNMIGDGAYGLELQYDKELKGEPGQISFDVDAKRRSFRARVDKPPVQGHSLILSLNRAIQYVAEREIKAGVEKAGAAYGTAIVLESDTGRVLALANYPDFNCNSYNEYPADLWRNRSVSDLFEPGSTFKVVVASAALEAGLTRPDELIDCQMGTITIGHHVFHDHKRYGLLTFSEVLEHSSNIGAAKLGLRLGEQRLYESLRTFGFGSKTGIDVPGEIIGLVRDWHQWSGLSIGAISFGQEVGVTSMQILCAINAIANGGYRTRPSLVDRIIDQNGDLVQVRVPERTRIMSDRTSAAVREAFEGVVLRGTGRKAALEGYRAAGKTGTAQKIVAGRYSDSKYVASFIGFAPLPTPRITVLVQIDEPRGSIYGGDVSAPVFSRIAQEALLQLRVPPDQTVPLPREDKKHLQLASSEDYLPNATPLQPSPEFAQVSQDESTVIRVATGELVMPDFTGLSKRRVAEKCLELGIQLRSGGSGFAVSQAPAAGTMIVRGAVCTVTFARIQVTASTREPVREPVSSGRDATPVAQATAIGR